ncbi:hypothetical protein ACWEKM_14265 [Streptomyces sp. NPDC004752]
MSSPYMVSAQLHERHPQLDVTEREFTAALPDASDGGMPARCSEMAKSGPRTPCCHRSAADFTIEVGAGA